MCSLKRGGIKKGKWREGDAGEKIERETERCGKEDSWLWRSPAFSHPLGLWFPLRPYVLRLDSSSAGWEWKRSFPGAMSPKRHIGLAKKLARIFLYPLMEKPNQLFGQPNTFVTTAPRLPGLPEVQNALRSEGREDKRSRETRKKHSMKQGKHKERKGWDWSFYFKIQPVLTALGQLALVGRGLRSLHLGVTLSLSLLCSLLWLRWSSKWVGSREGDTCLGYIPQGSGGAQWTWGPRPCPAKLMMFPRFCTLQTAGCLEPVWVGVGGCLCQLAQAANWLCVRRDTAWKKYTWKVLLFQKIIFNIL